MACVKKVRCEPSSSRTFTVVCFLPCLMIVVAVLSRMGLDVGASVTCVSVVMGRVSLDFVVVFLCNVVVQIDE